LGEAYQITDQSEIYFVTIQVVAWVDVFTRQRNKDVVIESLQYCQEKKGLLIYAFVIMSNHIHMIVRSERNDLSGTIRDFKKHVSKEPHLGVVWRKN